MKVDANRDLPQQLLDESRDGMLALDENGTIVAANEAAARLLLRERNHLIGKPFAVFVPLEHRKGFRHVLGDAVRNTPGAMQLPLPDGRGTADFELRPLRRTAPRRIAVAMFSDAHPVHSRREAERAKKGARFFMRLPHAVVGVNRDLRVAFANPLARHLLGGSAVQLREPPGKPKIPIDLGRLAHSAVSRPLAHVESPIELPDGRSIRVTTIPPSPPEPAVLLFEDVTAAQRHDRVMREFVRNAAHQLRTPLTGITSAVEVLQAGAKNVPEDRDRFLAHIERHAARLTRLARGLLVLARAQSGEQLLRLDFVELQPLFEALAADAETPPGVTVETSCSPSLAALAEPNLVHEVLAALIENAVAHTREGSVSLTAHEDEDGHVDIDVADGGPGILPEHEGRIFEPFYRAVETGDGFGLGLAIAAQAAKAMDGELRVATSPGNGTRFSIRLPSAKVMQ